MHDVKEKKEESVRGGMGYYYKLHCVPYSNSDDETLTRRTSEGKSI